MLYKPKKSILILLVLLAALMLTACGQKAAPKDTGGGKATSGSEAKGPLTKSYTTSSDLYADIAKLTPEEQDKVLLEGAKKEGLIRTYTVLDEPIIEEIKKDFEKQYPGVKVEYLSGKETDLTSRALSEFRGGKFLVDVLQIPPGIPAIKKEFALADLNKIPLLKNHPKAFYSKDWVAINYDGVVMVYNTKLVKPEEAPKTYEDLLDPKWKGKVAIDVNPVQMVSALLDKWGEAKTRDYLKKLMVDNKALVRKGHTNIMNMLIAGEFPIAAELFVYSTERSIAKGAPIDWVVRNPQAVTISSVSIVNKAPHPYAAMLFTKYYGTSEEASKVISKTGRAAINPKVPSQYSHINERLGNPKVQETFFSMSPDNTSKYEKQADALIKEFITSKI